MDWEKIFSHRARGLKSSVIRDLLKVINDPQIISLGGGMPAPELFPASSIQAAATKVLTEQGPQALQYSQTEGYPLLREFLVNHLLRRGIKVKAENILITNGSQQGLDLVAKALLDEHDPVVVEDPTYLGALQAFSLFQPKYLPISMDEDGMQVDLLDKYLQDPGQPRPKLIYSLPNFQNPTGITLSYERRIQLLRLAEKHGIPVVEDDPYGELRFEGEEIPPLAALGNADLMIYLGTFSKIFAPGLRLGWLVAPDPLMDKIIKCKQAADLHTDSLAQRIAYEYCSTGELYHHIEGIKSTYHHRQKAIVAAMKKYFPHQVKWTVPQGGMFVWVTLPDYLDTTQMLGEALTAKVAYVMGEAFYPSGGGKNTMRLNFSFSPPEVLEEAIRRLGGVLSKDIEARESGIRKEG